MDAMISSMGDKMYFKSKVVSRNIISDWIQGIRNFLGLELKGYTNVINETVKEMKNSITEDLAWFRIDIEQVSHNAFLISIYGELK